jgi:hypothetical protein
LPDSGLHRRDHHRHRNRFVLDGFHAVIAGLALTEIRF